MLRLVAIASLLCGCRISLEDNVALVADAGANGRACTVNMASQPCIDATVHSDLAFIEQKIFVPSCNIGSSCHASSSDPGKVGLQPGMSHDHLVGVSSMIDATRKLVVPNDVAASYLMLMLRDVAPGMASPPGNPPPGSVGFMPQSATTLCCQKLEAIERWINAGAPNH
jgi:hypothetical protein